MRDSVPSASYSSVCNVLRQWNILLIPTYRVCRLYDTDTCSSVPPPLPQIPCMRDMNVQPGHEVQKKSSGAHIQFDIDLDLAENTNQNSESSEEGR